MAKEEGTVLLIEDDADDRALVQEVWAQLNVPNQLVCFENGQQFLDYLSTTKDDPFIILCNLHMPGLSGFDVRDIINETPDLKNKSIPFVFLTSDARPSSINQAYLSIVQGYIIKSDTIQKLEDSLRIVYNYWKLCSHPHMYNK